MPQARVLKASELRRVLDHVATRPHAARNRAMLLLTHWAAMRIGEVAALRGKKPALLTGRATVGPDAAVDVPSEGVPQYMQLAPAVPSPPPLH